jgi:hypothetical protein
MKRGKWLVAALVCAVASGAASAVCAQATDKAAAEALFNEGRKLMADGDYAAACSKLEASQKLDDGVGTQLNLADCYEKSGRTASAWAQFRETVAAAHRAGSAERERVARERAQALEPRLSYLTIVAWSGQVLSVTRDDAPVDGAVLGTAIPVDPGKHVVSAAAPGKRLWTTTVLVGEHADHVTVSVPILPDEPNATAELSPSPSVAPAPVAAASVEAPNKALGTQRILGIVAAGVGVVGIAVGTVFGLQAGSRWSDAKQSCDPYPYCGEEGQRLAHDAKRSGTISTLAFVVGGVGLAGGAALWFTAPRRSPERQTALLVGPGSLQLVGSFE